MDYSCKEDIVEQFFEKAKSLIMPSESNNYKSKILQSKLLLYCVVFLLFLKIVTVLVSVNIPQNIFFADITKSALENFVNQTRQSQGLQPLSENDKLDHAAQLKAENMVQNNYFDHVSPSGITPWFWFSQAGYKYKYAGENLAIGFYDSQEVYDAWLNSPTHKANIVNPNYTEVGTAVLGGFGQGNTIVVVQEFGSQQPIKTTAVKNNNPKPVVTTNTKTANTSNTSNQTKKTQTAETKTNSGQSATANSVEKVLSQTTESKNLIEPSNGINLTNLSSKIANSVLYNYEGLLQNVIYGFSLIVIGILLTLIFFNFHINIKKQLVLRAALIMVLLSAATLINKEVLISFIPHQIFI